MSGETTQAVLSPITENMIRQLVHGFYAKVRADQELGPIFARVIGEDWDPHLEKMCAFWSSVMTSVASRTLEFRRISTRLNPRKISGRNAFDWRDMTTIFSRPVSRLTRRVVNAGRVSARFIKGGPGWS